MKLKNLQEAQDYLLKHVPVQSNQMFPGELGLKRSKYFLSLLDNPQNKLKVIHLAGTSGKGSTAYLTSVILKSQGFKVGLTVSPHLLDIRERVQINNALISEDKFVGYLNTLLPIVEKVSQSKYGTPSYFEILIALAFYTFFKEKVDYAVIETGLGGLHDGTNVITNSNKLVILTKIGHDHTQILGKRLTDIAYQKAGIIQNKNIIFSAPQTREVREVFDTAAKNKKTFITYIEKNKNFRNIKVSEEGTTFSYQFENLLLDIKLGLIGEHQVENCTLAVAAVSCLAKRDKFSLDEPKLLNSLKNSDFPGRFEIFHVWKKTIVLDGAHNPQKMKSFLKTLKKVFPDKKFDFLIAFKIGKDSQKMLKLIQPVCQNLFSTNFFITNQDLSHMSQQSQEISQLAKRLGINHSISIPNQNQAFKTACSASSNTLVITGSLYFLGDIYKLVKSKN